VRKTASLKKISLFNGKLKIGFSMSSRQKAEKCLSFQKVDQQKNQFLCQRLRTGLPDFSCFMIPKAEKMYQMNTNVPNGHTISQMTLKILKMALK
jgi:hypothetical protein